MRKLFILLLLTFSTVLISNAQKRITGQVKDAVTGEGLPGTTVVIKGTSIGTTTDIDGNYVLMSTAPTNVFEFSFIGYKTQGVAVENQTVINVYLIPDSKTLEEVVVTAIGIKAEKKSLGYAVQDVKGQDLTSTQQSNMVNALSGKVAGVEVVSSSGTPGASSNIVIRGRASLSSNNSPLFVIDGVPMSNDYSGSYYVDHSNRAIDVNSNDIESLTVLKGAAATALYGIRASNGAIIITTKSGKGKGDLRKNITFRSTLGFDEVNKLPQRQLKYAQGSYNAQGVPVYSSTANTSWGPLIETLRYDGDPNYPLDKNGRIVDMNDPTATDKRVFPYDNVPDFFQTAIKSDSYISMSGGNENGNLFTSIGHLNQSGIVPNSEFKRTTFKITGDFNLTKRFKISGSASYSNSGGTFLQRGSNLSAVMVGLMRLTPTFDITNGSSDPVNDESAYMFPDGTQRNYYSLYDNPYWSINKNKATSEVNRVIGNSQVDYKILPWLSALYRVGIDYYTDKRNSYLDNNSSDTDNGYISISNYEFKSINSDFLVTAEKELTESLKLTLSGGHNFFTYDSYEVSQRGDLFILPNFYDISNTAQTSGDDTKRRYMIVGAFYDFKLSYRNYLFFNTTGRNDWSSTLPANKNSFFYPSVNLSFIFTDAFNIKDKLTFFDFGKARVSWAQVGNDAGLYALENYYTSINGGIQGQVAYATQTSIGNKKIKPEKTTSVEFGIDLRFFKNKLGIDFAYYDSKSVGQIIRVPVPYSTGFSSMTLNSGIVSNKGVELQLFVTPYEAKDFIWDFSLNFSKNKNIVEDLPDGIPLIEFATTGLSSTRSVGIEGQPFGVLYGGRFLRNENGAVLVGNDGYPLINPVAGIVGDPNPDFTLGFRNTFTFKGLSLTALIDYKQGGDIYNGTRGVMTSLGTHKDTENREEDFIFNGVNVNTGEPNTVVVKRNRDYYSRQGGLAGLSEAYIEDGTYVRLREVSMSYSIPKKWLTVLPVSGLNIGVSGRNLFLKTKYSGIDPETNLSGASNSLGRDYFNMPNTRSYEFSLQFTF
jgi:TonB-linked SusC/RagA family outer membrane protein